LKLYLDASILMSLFIAEARMNEAHGALEGQVLIISDFAIAEFSSCVAHRARRSEIAIGDAASVFATFDSWISRAARRKNLMATDIMTAFGFVRRLDLVLRTPDAINIAIAQRLGVILFTFDTKMSASARALGLDVID
jgi:predicted nucleic acid-binding protein